MKTLRQTQCREVEYELLAKLIHATSCENYIATYLWRCLHLNFYLCKIFCRECVNEHLRSSKLFEIGRKRLNSFVISKCACSLLCTCISFA